MISGRLQFGEKYRAKADLGLDWMCKEQSLVVAIN